MTSTLSQGFVLESSDAGENGHSHDHSVQFYDGEAYLLDELSPYIGEALKRGDAAIVIATPAHRAALAERLILTGIDVGTAERRGLYVALDATQTLERFMVNGLPDPDRFAETIGSVMERTREVVGPAGRIAAFGEMVALLYAEGQAAAAINLEQLWNELANTHDFQLRCAYPIHVFPRAADGSSMETICAEHTTVLPTEGYTSLDADVRGAAIVLLEQKAKVLEREVAERKRAEEALADRNRQLAEAVATREAFLSIAAHELKTPLTGLRLSAQLVQRLMKAGAAGAHQIAPALERLDAQTDKLARLVDQLLDVSRMQQGHLALEPVETDVCSLVRTVVENIRAAAPDHEIELSTPGEALAQVDPLRIEQVVSNLLDNAVKYSPDGGQIEVELAQPEPGWLRLVVRDHGIGIDPDSRDRVFEAFYRAPRTNNPAGMGLGLHISRQIVELHGGRIQAEFPEDGGTRMVVTLPTNES